MISQFLNFCSLSLINTLTLVLFPLKRSQYSSSSLKSDKQCLKSYRPVSYLRKKIRKLFNEMFKFLIESNLISSNQSDLKLGNSCINQLSYITHEIYKSSNDMFEVRCVFVDISKLFDKVRHKSTFFKLKQNGVSGKLRILFKSLTF